MPSCFIIMPLTTPEALVPLYGQDGAHFTHVLEHLFVPAVLQAEFDPIKPIAQGADVIQAEIIKNLETADLILCDISSLNPNVFFELGCRTALNKPVCYVMDDLTRGIPFDTGIINHHTYSHKLAPWTLSAEIQQLAHHVRTSAERSAGKNMLWQYFGLRTVAQAAKSGNIEQDRLEYLVMQVEAIRKELDNHNRGATAFTSYDPNTYQDVWSEVSTQPTGYVADGINYLVPKAPDWDQVIKDSESDLEQMEPLRRPEKRRLDIRHVKGIIEGHIKSLSELIQSEPQTARAAKARKLQVRLQNLLLTK